MHPLKYSAVFITMMLALNACSADKSEEAPYAAEYAAAMSEAKSDYVKSMLEDGEITAAEMQDAQGQLVSCLTQAGFDASYEDTGYGFKTLAFLGELGSDQWPAEQACRDQWMGNNDFLYQDQITNPQNGDLDSLIAECLVRKELVASGFTGKDYQELHEPYIQHFTLESGESYEATETPEIVLPGGVSLNDPAAVLCLITPTR